MTGAKIDTLEEMEEAARQLQEFGARHVLIKGGHSEAGDATDVLLAGTSVIPLKGERYLTNSTHGTGCSYATAIATLLAQGRSLVNAVATAKRYISEAIRTAIPLGSGHGPINHMAGARSINVTTEEER